MNKTCTKLDPHKIWKRYQGDFEAFLGLLGLHPLGRSGSDLAEGPVQTLQADGLKGLSSALGRPRDVRSLPWYVVSNAFWRFNISCVARWPCYSREANLNVHMHRELTRQHMRSFFSDPPDRRHMAP